MTTGTLDLSRVDAERRRLESANADLPAEDRPSPDELALDVDPATRAHRIVEQVLAEAERGEGTPGTSRPAGVAQEEDSPGAVAHRIVREVLAAEAATASRLERSAGDPSSRAAQEVDDTSASDRESEWTPSIHRRHLVLLGADGGLVLVPGPVYEPRDGAFVPTRIPTTLEGLVERVVSSFDGRSRASDDVRAAIRGAAESEALPGSRWLVLGVLWAAAVAAATPFAGAALGSAIDFRIDLWGDEPAMVQEAEATTDAPSIDGTP